MREVVDFEESLVKVVVGTGFEPVKAMPADLQSAPVGRLGILPSPVFLSCRSGNHLTEQGKKHDW